MTHGTGLKRLPLRLQNEKIELTGQTGCRQQRQIGNGRGRIWRLGRQWRRQWRRSGTDKASRCTHQRQRCRRLGLYDSGRRWWSRVRARLTSLDWSRGIVTTPIVLWTKQPLHRRLERAAAASAEMMAASARHLGLCSGSCRGRRRWLHPRLLILVRVHAYLFGLLGFVLVYIFICAIESCL